MTADTERLEIIPARGSDLWTIATILEKARQGIVARGVVQWTQPFSDEWIADKIAAGEFHLTRRDGQPAAVIRLLWKDAAFWGDRDDGTASYVHTLAVRPSASGRQIGLWILDWAAVQTRAKRRRFVRLDCGAANAALCAYYERAGFAPVEDVHLGGETLLLYEKLVGTP